MRTLPANFSTGLSSNYKAIWCLKITTDTNPLYWLSDKRDNTGNTLYLRTGSGALGGELCTNTDFELDTTGWTAEGTGTTIAKYTSEYHGGAACARFNILDGGRVFTGIDIDGWYTVEFYAKRLSGDSNAYTPYLNIGTNRATPEYSSAFTLTADWVKYTFTFYATQTNIGVYGLGNCDFLVDDFSIKKHTYTNLTYDSSILSKLINGRNVNAMNEIEQSIDLIEGGAISSFSDLSISCLNQDRLDLTIIPLNLENQTVQLYFGFVPPSSQPALNLTDMITLWNGVIGSIQYNYDEIRINLTDGIEKKHKDIPQTIITKDSYPYAPEESLDQVLPILYGDFDTGVSVYYGIYDICPSICIDEKKNIFCVAGHVTHSYVCAYYYDGAMKFPALVYSLAVDYSHTAPTLDEDNSGIATVTLAAGDVIGVITHPFSYASAGNNITDFEKSIDGDSTTYASVDNTASKALALCLDGIEGGEAVTNSNIEMWCILDANLASAQSFEFYDGTNRVVLPAGSSNILVTMSTPANYDVSELMNYTWMLRDNPDFAPAAETAKVKAMGVRYVFRASNKVSTLSKTLADTRRTTRTER